MRSVLILVAATAALGGTVAISPATAGPVSTDAPLVQVKPDECGNGYNVYVLGRPVLPRPDNVWCPEDPPPS